jgi:hypothetical protein
MKVEKSKGTLHFLTHPTETVIALRLKDHK